MHDIDTMIDDIIRLTLEGENKLDMGAVDLAFDRFISIREKANVIKKMRDGKHK